MLFACFVQPNHFIVYFLFFFLTGQTTRYSMEEGPFLRQIRQFYRFGRALSPEWDSDEDWVIHNSDFSDPQSLEDDGLLRDRRQFYRFGRTYHPYQDKRFLRFGRSSQPDVGDYGRADLVQSDVPLYRKRRSSENSSQSEHFSHKNLHVSELTHQSEKPNNNIARETVQDMESYPKSDYVPFTANLNEEENSQMGLAGSEKRFMRFGRSSYPSEDNLDFENAEDGDHNFDKRFMRFGKRFMRFGRGDEDDESYEKRFMRFGKSMADEGEARKRFFRFGKRFMRFGKRFMRFGTGDKDLSDHFLKSGNHGESKRFSRSAR